MEIRELNVDEIIPYENNPRFNDEAVEAVANSIKEFGFKVPIILDKDKVIIAGHTRLLAAKRLGMESVPVIFADDLTEEQVKAFRLADNKVGEIATWDITKLNKELEELKDLGVQMDLFGFEMPDVNIVVEDDYDIDTALNEIKEPCVFDMELAYICSLFDNVEAIKIVSDNLSMDQYEEMIKQ